MQQSWFNPPCKVSGHAQDDWEEDEAAQRQLLETISRIRNKDSAIYDPAVQLQPDDSDDAQTEDAGAAAPKAKKQRAMRLAEINMREVCLPHDLCIGQDETYA